MSMFDLSAKDVMRGARINPPGWYLVRIDSVGELTVSSKGDSYNCNLDGTIVKNVDSGDEKYAGYPTPRWSFNTKAPGFITGFLRALGHEPEVGRNNLKVGEGKLLEVFIGDNEYQGKINSQVEHQYRSPRD